MVVIDYIAVHVHTQTPLAQNLFFYEGMCVYVQYRNLMLKSFQYHNIWNHTCSLCLNNNPEVCVKLCFSCKSVRRIYGWCEKQLMCFECCLCVYVSLFICICVGVLICVNPWTQWYHHSKLKWAKVINSFVTYLHSES